MIHLFLGSQCLIVNINIEYKILHLDDVVHCQQYSKMLECSFGSMLRNEVFGLWSIPVNTD